MKNYPKTIFCDIDGVIFKHCESSSDVYRHSGPSSILPESVNKFNEWNRKGYRIILTTGRPESMRSITVTQISESGLFYHQLVMDLPRGARVVINDSKPDSSKTAFAFSLVRDEGLGSVDI